ncbi:hypothetical protein JW960_18990 [candidate division KSB1 bacterium]|nr:hypothetical protein [candidate division KSB1 bacterium]
MKYLYQRSYIIIIILLMAAGTAHARLGLGVMLGEPTGISIKNWHTKQKAVDAAVAWSLGKHGRFHIHADYLHHNYNLLSEFSARRRLPAYIGLGARMAINEDDNDNILIGMRVPVGCSYLFMNYPFDVFFELAPTFDVIPETSFELNGAVGVRIYFN